MANRVKASRWLRRLGECPEGGITIEVEGEPSTKQTICNGEMGERGQSASTAPKAPPAPRVPGPRRLQRFGRWRGPQGAQGPQGPQGKRGKQGKTGKVKVVCKVKRQCKKVTVTCKVHYGKNKNNKNNKNKKKHNKRHQVRWRLMQSGHSVRHRQHQRGATPTGSSTTSVRASTPST